jgi:hypothetical protein
MSESLLSADRNTHLKIAAVALIAVAIMVAVGLNARTTGSDLVAARGNTDGPVVKAGTPVTYSDAERSTKQ